MAPDRQRIRMRCAVIDATGHQCILILLSQNLRLLLVGQLKQVPRSRARSRRIGGVASPTWPIPSVTAFVSSNSWAADTTKSPTRSGLDDLTSPATFRRL